MNVIAIDPGTTRSAIVMWDGSTIQSHAILDNERLRDCLRKWNHDEDEYHLVVELIRSYGMAVGAEVFDTCIWIGRFVEAFKQGESHSLVPRSEVKVHLCGSTRAKDANIRQALMDRLGAPGRKKYPGVTYGIKSDEWAALALAVTWWDKYCQYIVPATAPRGFGKRVRKRSDESANRV